MRNKDGHRWCSLILFLLIFSIPSVSMRHWFFTNLANDTLSINSSSPLEMRNITPTRYGYSLSDSYTPSPAIGTMNPVTVEQSGYSETANISARTDSGENTELILTIDTEHNWSASTAEVNLMNLKKIYAENGTFDEGYPGTNLNPVENVTYHPLGWDATSMTGDIQQTQLASYHIGAENYVIVENQGYPVGPAFDRDYQHFAGTNITWIQNVTNIPYNQDFILRFRYMYFRGPIGAVPSGNCSIIVCIDGNPVWNYSLLVVEQRGIWFDSGEIPISQEGIGDSFEIQIGISIDETMVLDPNTDYNSDGIIAGIENTYFITTFFDDFTFESLIPPSCDEVNLRFSVNESHSAIIGSDGTGYGLLENEVHWDTNSLDFSITSNTSISFTYIARLLNHRYLNSCWTTNTLEHGVGYIIETEKSGNLEWYTYLGFLEEYEELTLKMKFPYDWENITVFDPFLTDVTSICICNEDSIIIPESISNRLGWWKFTLNSQNYASSAVIERYDTNTSSWVDENIFHTFDFARLNVSIGTVNDTPELTNPVSFAWCFPNCTIWEESSIVGGVGIAISPSIVFGPTNTTAGIWGIKYLWTNGSELAYSCKLFELHHKAALELVFSDSLKTVVGQPLTVVLSYFDTENGQLILDGDVSIVGHWIGSDIEFVVDVVNNWWQADFDTAPFGAGNFEIYIVSNSPWFDTDALEISISSYFLTSLDAPADPIEPLVYGRQYNFEYFYALFNNNTGIDGATVEVFEEGSEWITVENIGNGYYTLSLQPMLSHEYTIRIRFSKEGFENQTHTLTFHVDDVKIEVGSISSLAGIELTRLRIEVQIVESDTRNSVIDANVTLAIYRPGDYLYYNTLMDEESPGVYSTTVQMPSADSGTYTVRISVEKDNHRMVQEFSAVLIPTYDLNWRLVSTLITYSWQIGIIAGLAILVVMGQKVRIRKRRQKHASAMEFKNRLNDANNILGLIVLHKLSGVPIYSQVFKDGFEEGLLSAFISAIMQFREAIDAGKPEDYAIVPISEVMRVVPTENLICALITMTPSSTEQERKMVSFARAVGMMLDESLAHASGKIIDKETCTTFELLFDNLLDGYLIHRYRTGEKKIPKSLKLIKKGLQHKDARDTFVLYDLVRILTPFEISLDDIYIEILRAIEEKYIIPVYQYTTGDERLIL